MDYSGETLEDTLDRLPDEIADALSEWRIATLEREKTEALLLLSYKAKNPERTAQEIKALVMADPGRYEVALKEATAEAEYTRLSEGLMAAKKKASLRVQL
jgi:predicted Zn-dependent peptidase